MHRLLNKRGLFVGIVLTALFFITPSSKSFAYGIDFGEHCWSGDTSGVLIKFQVTQFRNFYNLNGSVTLNPAYGTAFLDTAANKIKMGYTLIKGNQNDVLGVYIELTPGALNGTKTVIFQNGNTSQETVTHIPCP